MNNKEGGSLPLPPDLRSSGTPSAGDTPATPPAWIPRAKPTLRNDTPFKWHLSDSVLRGAPMKKNNTLARSHNGLGIPSPGGFGGTP
jgi:hypothetical protein